MDYSVGRYRVRVLSQRIKVAKTGTHQFELQVQPIAYHGFHGEEDVSERPTRTIRWFLTEKAIDFCFRDLAALGWEGESFRELEQGQPGFHSFAGVEFDAIMKMETYEGNPQERWSAYLSEPEPLADDDLSKLDKMFASKLKRGGKTKAAPKTSPVRKQAEAVYSGEPNGKDNIPF